MKKKNLLVFSSAMMLLVSCGGGASSSPSSQSTGPSSEPSSQPSTGFTSDPTPSSNPSSQSTPSSESSQATPSTGKHGLPVFTNDKVTEPSIIIHYYAYDDVYNLNAIWCWKTGGEGALYEFPYEDAVYGEMIAVIPLSGIDGKPTFDDTVGVIFRPKDSWTGQTKDLVVNLSEFELHEGKMKHVYFMKDDETPRAEGIYERADKFTKNIFINPTRINLMTSNDVDKWTLYIDGTKFAEKSLSEDDNRRDILIKLKDYDENFEVDLSKVYELEAHFVRSDATIKAVVGFDGLYGNAAFNNAYAYDGDDLGAVYSKEETSFKVWSPVSSSIKVRIYSNGTPKSVDATTGDDTYEEYDLVKGDKGVFSGKVTGDLNKKYYTYFVVNNANPKGKEIVDPYAKSCGVNGLRGQILDFSGTNPEGWEEVTPHNYNRKELAIYETHLVDPTYSDSWSANPSDRAIKGTYEAFHRDGTYIEGKDKSYKTGFDHIVDLGVNAVQIMPIFDQANDEINKSFNWGYNPLNYNCLEGSYSSDPYRGEIRVREFKELVKSYNEAGINIIMDVVYNHVNSVSGLGFDVLMPGYYFRYNDDGTLSNGSGCGNETASDHYMYSKFMIDSAKFWATEYKLGGFRFDLMGLHDLETMANLTKTVKEATFDNFCVLGEPWEGGSTPLAAADRADQANIDRFEGFGSFNDLMRDGMIKSGMSAESDQKGWIDGDPAKKSTGADTWSIMHGMAGKTANTKNGVKNSDPNKAVNYVSCHDNFTVTDRVAYAYSTDKGKTTSASEKLLHEAPKLSNGLVMTSQGTSFMLSGEEFGRRKIKADGTLDGNSYNASYEENAIDYTCLVTDPQREADVNFFKEIIRLKTTQKGFSQEQEAIKENVTTEASDDNSLITATVKQVEETQLVEYKILAKNNMNGNITVDLSGYDIIVDSFNVAEPNLAEFQMEPLQFVVAKRVVPAN